tara:strand:+ start:2609 stop:2761 length:153 start_codon:yes stop_codon:yes gene_type:complete
MSKKLAKFDSKNKHKDEIKRNTQKKIKDPSDRNKEKYNNLNNILLNYETI